MNIKNKNRIRDLRTQAGMKQNELAEKLGFNGNNKDRLLRKYENGTVDISAEILEKLSDIFNCSYDYILCKSDKKNEYEGKEIWISLSDEAKEKGITDEELEEHIRYLFRLKDKYKYNKKED